MTSTEFFESVLRLKAVFYQVMKQNFLQISKARKEENDNNI